MGSMREKKEQTKGATLILSIIKMNNKKRNGNIKKLKIKQLNI